MEHVSFKIQFMIYCKRIIAIVSLIVSQGILAQMETKICDATLNNPCLVQDSELSSSPLKWLRDASMILEAYQGNTLGIKELSISGSEEPSEKGWKDIADYIAKHKGKESKTVLVIDLRQESHGYLNGRAITLVSEYDWINRGKSNHQSLVAQENWLDSLNKEKKISGVLSVQQFAAKEYSSGKTVAVKKIKNEKELVSRLGFEYNRLYVTDHMAPSDTEVDSFLTILKNAPKDAWFHIHCRGGKGRTTTFLVMFDMLKNANKVGFDEIIARHAAISPYYNLFEVNRADPYLTIYYEQRLIFLSRFYQFAQQYLKGYPESWSEWVALRSIDH